MRMTGFSGIDVADMVNQMMRVESMRLDRLRQNRDVMVWQQQQMREVTSSVRQFQNRFLTISTATGADSIRQPANFAAMRANVTGGNGITINAQSNAPAGSHTLEVQTVAQAHGLRGNANHNTGAQTTQGIDLRAFMDLNTGDVTGGTFRVNVNGVVRNIELNEATLRSTFGNAVFTDIHTRHQAFTTTMEEANIRSSDGTPAFGGFHFQNEVDARFNAHLADNGITIGDLTTDEINELNERFENEVIAYRRAALTAANNDAMRSYSTGTVANPAALQTAINTQLQAFGNNPAGAGGGPRATATFTADGVLTISAAQGNTLTVLGGVGAGGVNVQQMGFGADGSATAALSAANTSIADFMGFGPLDPIEFTINGHSFDFDCSNSIQDVINEVNNRGIGVRMSFNASLGQFQLDATQTGAAAGVDSMVDVTGNFLSRAFVDGASTNTTQLNVTGGTFGAGFNEFRAAQDAVFLFNSVPMSRENNNFVIDGLNITLTAAAEGQTFNVDVARDAGDVRQLVNNFINAYNDMVRSIIELTETRRPRQNGNFFMPLTQEQRRSMSDSEVREWEERAMTGILHRNEPLRNLMNDMRNALFMNVPFEGGYINLAHIGIRSVQDIGGFGMIEIRDEEIFENFLNNNPEAISALFTTVELRSGFTNASGQVDERAWFAASGLADRLNDIMNRALSNRSGSLASFAGIPLNMTYNNNILTNRINEQDQRINRMMDWLERRENQLFAQFGRMETAMMQAQSQMMFFEQMFWM